MLKLPFGNECAYAAPMTTSAQVTAVTAVTPDTADTAPEPVIGGKAAGLRWLAGLHWGEGITVPAFAVIGDDLFREHLRAPRVASAMGLAALAVAELDPAAPGSGAAAAAALAPVHEAVLAEPASPALVAAVAAARAGLGDGPFAVRSSMQGEDSAQHSYAGRLDSFLNQRTDPELVRSVIACWASAFGPRCAAYAVRTELAPASIRMGVVIQELVAGRVSGVAVTADPATGDRSTGVISAAPGLGEAVVGGEFAVDEFTWSAATGRQTGARVAVKAAELVPDSEGPGLVSRSVDAGTGAQPCLTPGEVERIAAASTVIAHAAGQPMDVEWALLGPDLVLLQARPMTNLPQQAETGGTVRIFDDSNVQESYNGVVSPLTFSFASRAYACVYRTFAETFCVTENARRRFEPAARTMISQVHGRVFYNLESWWSMLDLVPGSARTREYLAQIMWHTTLEDTEEALPKPSERAAKAFELTIVGLKLGAAVSVVDRTADRFVERFWASYRAVDREGLKDYGLSDLLSLGRHLQTVWLERWDAPTINNWRVAITCGRLRRLLAVHYPEADVDLRLSDLLGGIDDIESVKPARMLMDLAARIAADAQATATLTTGTPEEALAALQSVPWAAAGVDAYLDRYGDRCMGELRLEAVTGRDDPGFIISVLRNYVSDPSAADAEREGSLRQRERYEAVRADLLAKLPAWQRPAIGGLIGYTRKALWQRERLRIMRTLAFGVARDVYRAMGRRLAEAGVLASWDDVYYLSVDELDAYIEGRAVSADLAGMAAVRRAEYAIYEAEAVPSRFRTVGPPYLGNVLREVRESESSTSGGGTLLTGLGASGGVVTAPIRVVHDVRSELGVNGQILVAAHTDPGWALLFPTAAGLIVERGSHLSHAAVVAREFGIPTVIGLTGATSLFTDGEVVTVDGDAGTVRRT
jgi:rifampicin phosphotransferase